MFPPGAEGGGGAVGGGCAIGMFHSEGYGFQAVYSEIGYKESLGSRKLINWLKISLDQANQDLSLTIRIKSKELPLLNKRKPRMKLIVRTRQLAKKPSAHF